MMGRRARDAARIESVLLRACAALRLIRDYTQQWQAQHDVGSWRFPPDNYVGRKIKIEFPAIRLDDLRPLVNNSGTLLDFAYSGEQWADYIVREQFEAEHPIPDGFKPVTQLRTDDKNLFHKLREQERRNLPHFPKYQSALRNLKHDKGKAGVAPIFKDDSIDTSLPLGTLVWHQIQGSPNDPIANTRTWSFTEHLTLREGEVIRYDHIRSTTIKAWWFGTLGGDLDQPLNSALPYQESAVLLELIPRSGLFISDASNEVLNTHLGSERELILPPHTYWQVVGIRDIAFDNDRLSPGLGRDIQRVRGIQMVEIAHPTTGDAIRSMTRSTL